MKSVCFVIMAGVIALGLTACAPLQKYHPEPIVPAATALRLERRSLSDPGLRRFMEQNRKLTAWPLRTWNLNDLALAAYYFNPQMQVARKEAEAAEAGIITAGERPNPMVTLRPGIPSPYLLSLRFDVPIQTAGRRSYKIKQAAALTQAARFNLAAIAWKVRSGVRAALVQYFFDEQQAELAVAETRFDARQVQGLRARWVAGEIARPAVVSAEASLLHARRAARAASGRVLEDRAALAASIGVPQRALDGIRLGLEGFAHPPDTRSLSPQFIEREAVIDRLDVRQALAEYAAAEAALQLEIARQHPNIQIGPGYSFEEGSNYFTTGLAAVLPIFNRNQGPIAQAEAERKLAAARLMAVQSQAIAQSEAALARYRSALAEWRDAQKSRHEIRRILEPLSKQSVTVGEADWLALNGVQLEGVRAAGVALQSLDQAQQALGQLEDAVERPLEAGEAAPAFRPVHSSRALLKPGRTH
jgi:cobalt-zinc-cadmium efflux system outer membrane protein